MLPICKPLYLHTKRPKPVGYPEKIETIGEHLRSVRLDRGLSQREVAEQLNINSCTVATWENYNKKIAPKFMKLIIDFLGYVPPLDVDKNTLAGRLYIYRCKHGLTLKDISLSLNIDGNAPIRIENNQEVEQKYIDKIEALLNSENERIDTII